VFEKACYRKEMKNKCEAQNRPKNARSEQKPFLANFGTGMRANILQI